MSRGVPTTARREKTPVELDGVAETLLWTLYHRACEARRPDAVLHDPWAVRLVDEIDYPFAERFGDGAGLGQWQALRARCFDDQVRRFLDEHPDGMVVALGEGLETQLWRVDNGRVHWLSVDLPETIAVREALLPPPPRQRLLACSVLDERWMDEVDASRGVLLTAQGLLMYLELEDAYRVVAHCARRFGGGALVFDAVPRWLSERTRRSPIRTAGGFEPPPWSWGLDAHGERLLRSTPGVAELVRLRLPRGRGLAHGAVLPLVGQAPGVRRALLSVLLARFAGQPVSRRPGG